MGCGRAFSATATWANGATQRLMATESTSGKMAIDTKAVGIFVSNTAKDLIYLRTVTLILEIIKKGGLTAKVFTNGKT